MKGASFPFRRRRSHPTQKALFEAATHVLRGHRQCFAELLREMGRQELISQMHDGALVLGLDGERIVNRHDFYAVFQTPEEYGLIHNGRLLGSLPILFPVAEGIFLIFAGRRWEIVAVGEVRKTIDLRLRQDVSSRCSVGGARRCTIAFAKKVERVVALGNLVASMPLASWM